MANAEILTESQRFWKWVLTRRTSRRTLLRAAAVGAVGTAAAAIVGCEGSDPKEDRGQTSSASLGPSSLVTAMTPATATAQAESSNPNQISTESKTSKNVLNLGDWSLSLEYWEERGGNLDKDPMIVVIGTSLKNISNKTLPSSALSQDFTFSIAAGGSHYDPLDIIYHDAKENKEAMTHIPPGLEFLARFFFEIPGSQKNWSLQVKDTNTDKPLGKIEKAELGK